MVRQVGPSGRAEDAVTKGYVDGLVGTPPTRISVGQTNGLTSGYRGEWWQTDASGNLIGLQVETAGADGPAGSRISVGTTNGLTSGTKGVWWQTDASGNLITLWVETAGS